MIYVYVNHNANYYKGSFPNAKRMNGFGECRNICFVTLFRSHTRYLNTDFFLLKQNNSRCLHTLQIPSADMLVSRRVLYICLTL